MSGENGVEAGDAHPRRMVVREVLDERTAARHRSDAARALGDIGVWLTRGSRHETDERGGIAHFVEHMLFKGTDTR